MRLYISAVLSIMVYGSEAWRLTAEVKRAINGVNSKMVAAITGRTIQEEAQKDGKTFDAVASIRATRLKWLGCILRMDANRMVQKAVKQLYHHRQEGDILMDAPTSGSWEDLVAKAKANDGKDWRMLVREIKDTITIKVASGKGKGNDKKRTQSKKAKKESGKDTSAGAAKASKSSKDEEATKRQRREVDKDDDETDEDDDWGSSKGKQVYRKKLQRPIYCKDGFMMSVQASREHFCSPRDDFGPYDGVEVGYPSEWEDLLLPFTDNNTDRTPAICGMAPTLYVNVPPSTIRAIIQKHGGMTAESGKLPPMTEVDADGHLWAAAAEPPSTSEEEEEEDAPTSVVHLGAPPPLPPPLPPVTPTGPRVTTTQARRGALTPPHALTDAGLSPIER